jgi:hypothetical protein
MGIIKVYVLEKENANDEFAIITNKPYSDNEYIKKDDLILEYETSKANFEIRAEVSGYIKYYFSVDEEVNYGDKILEIHDSIAG